MAGLTRGGGVPRVSGESALAAMALFGAGSASAETLPLLAFALLGGLAWLASRPRARDAYTDFRFVATLGIVLFAFQALGFEAGTPVIDAEGARSALRSTARIAGGYGAARAFYSGLGVSRIRDSLARFSRPFSRAGSGAFESLALVLGFVPTVLAAWVATEEAARARGFLRSGPGGSRTAAPRALRMLAATVAAFLRNLLLLARDVAEARAARGTGRARRSLPPFKVGTADFLLVAAASTPLALGLLY